MYKADRGAENETGWNVKKYIYIKKVKTLQIKKTLIFIYFVSIKIYCNVCHFVSIQVLATSKCILRDMGNKNLKYAD